MLSIRTSLVIAQGFLSSRRSTSLVTVKNISGAPVYDVYIADEKGVLPTNPAKLFVLEARGECGFIVQSHLIAKSSFVSAKDCDGCSSISPIEWEEAHIGED